MRIKRFRHGCFSIDENGTTTKVVVMGGGSLGFDKSGRLPTAEILDVTSMQWEDLPNLPFGVTGNKGVESAIGPDLGFSVGGVSWYERYERQIVGLRKNQNGTYFWQELWKNQLTTGRNYAAVVNVPDAMVPPCQR